MMHYLLLALVMLHSSVIAETKVLTRADVRMSPTATPFVHRVVAEGTDKVLSFVFWTGDLFISNPGAHVWVIADGWIDSTNRVPLQGRGITIGRTHMCDGVGFEHFGGMTGKYNEFPGDCLEINLNPYQFYTFVLYVEDDSITVRVRQNELTAYFAKEYPAFDTIIGVAGDNEPSMSGFFNVFHKTW